MMASRSRTNSGNVSADPPDPKVRIVDCRFSFDVLEISERDILDGAALAAADLPEAEEGAAPPGAYSCC